HCASPFGKILDADLDRLTVILNASPDKTFGECGEGTNRPVCNAELVRPRRFAGEGRELGLGVKLPDLDVDVIVHSAKEIEGGGDPFEVVREQVVETFEEVFPERAYEIRCGDAGLAAEARYERDHLMVIVGSDARIHAARREFRAFDDALSHLGREL